MAVSETIFSVWIVTNIYIFMELKQMNTVTTVSYKCIKPFVWLWCIIFCNSSSWTVSCLCVAQIFLIYAVFSLHYLLSLHASISVYCLTLLYEMRLIYTLYSEKVSPFYSLNNSMKNEPISIILVLTEEISHHQFCKNYKFVHFACKMTTVVW